MNMGQEREPRLTEQEVSQGQATSKKPYQKPAFRHERVFETQALSCGKLVAGNACLGRSKKTS